MLHVSTLSLYPPRGIHSFFGCWKEYMDYSENASLTSLCCYLYYPSSIIYHLPFSLVPVSECTLKAPIYNPEKIICIGMNYVDHCTEQVGYIDSRWSKMDNCWPTIVDLNNSKTLYVLNRTRVRSAALGTPALPESQRSTDCSSVTADSTVRPSWAASTLWAPRSSACAVRLTSARFEAISQKAMP